MRDLREKEMRSCAFESKSMLVKRSAVLGRPRMEMCPLHLGNYSLSSSFTYYRALELIALKTLYFLV